MFWPEDDLITTLTNVVCRHSRWFSHFLIIIIITILDIHSPTTHLAPRSLCMRKTVQWRPGFSECGKSLIKWECGGQWREFLLSMSTGYLMCYSCSWGPLSSSCEYYSRGSCTNRVWSWKTEGMSLLCRPGGELNPGEDEVEGLKRLMTEVTTSESRVYTFCCYGNCQHIIILDGMTDPWTAGWCKTGLGDWRLHWQLVAS